VCFGSISHFLTAESEIDKSLPCLINAYIAYFTLQKFNIGPISEGVFTISHIITKRYLGPTPFDIRANENLSSRHASILSGLENCLGFFDKFKGCREGREVRIYLAVNPGHISMSYDFGLTLRDPIPDQNISLPDD